MDNQVKLSQDSLPIFEALEKQALDRLVHFDVPGHKGGRGNKDLKKYLGESAPIEDSGMITCQYEIWG